MTTTTLTLTAFLVARLEEEGRDAEVWSRYGILELSSYRDEWTGRKRPGGPVTVGDLDPTRVLAQVASIRAIVAMLGGSEDFRRAMPSPGYAEAYHSPSVDVLTRVLQLLAAPYASHPDWREEWSV